MCGTVFCMHLKGSILKIPPKYIDTCKPVWNKPLGSLLLARSICMDK